jgi:FtsP/CotA-like multicopper oxidase with cupredoxin domain
VFGYTPFTQPLFLPAVLQPTLLSPAPGNRPSRPRGVEADVAHGIAREFDGRDGALHCSDWNRFSNTRTHEKEYLVFTEETTQQIFPGVHTPVFTYRDGTLAEGSGHTPGPTVLARFREPVVVRHVNRLTRDRVSFGHDIETSVHLHGSHSPAHPDGYPDFYVLAGEARDYFYPNIAPRKLGQEGCGGEFDPSWIPSTMWYHDHAMDITGFTVAHGLAGFYLLFDDFEQGLTQGPSPVLPAIGGPFDLGLALQDQRFHADGTLFYDFLDHNGRIGDVFTVNGRAQPFLRVQRRKYRFRVLDAANARHYEIRLSSGAPLLLIGTDSWLQPVARSVPSVNLTPGERHDVVVDFRNAPSELFLENILFQPDGRGPKGVDLSQRTPLLKFIVEGAPVANDVTVTDGTALRPYVRHDPARVVRTRTFEFERSNGAWVMNDRFFNPRRADADPVLGTLERWIFVNKSNGWAHPVHPHLEGHEIVKLNGKPPPFEHAFRNDITPLPGNGKAEVLIAFRTFTGPFVMHCHTIEHEDMRMMVAFDPRRAGQASPLDGVTRIDPQVSGVVPDCDELEAEERIFFDAAGDVDRLEGRGVGFPDCEFEPD